MPFKSKAQRRKFAALLVQGKITPETYEEWNRETGAARLPERVRSKKESAAARKRTSAKKRTSGKRAVGKKRTARRSPAGRGKRM